MRAGASLGNHRARRRRHAGILKASWRVSVSSLFERYEMLSVNSTKTAVLFLAGRTTRRLSAWATNVAMVSVLLFDFISRAGMKRAAGKINIAFLCRRRRATNSSEKRRSSAARECYEASRPARTSTKARQRLSISPHFAITVHASAADVDAACRQDSFRAATVSKWRCWRYFRRQSLRRHQALIARCVMNSMAGISASVLLYSPWRLLCATRR